MEEYSCLAIGGHSNHVNETGSTVHAGQGAFWKGSPKRSKLEQMRLLVSQCEKNFSDFRGPSAMFSLSINV